MYECTHKYVCVSVYAYIHTHVIFTYHVYVENDL